MAGTDDVTKGGSVAWDDCVLYRRAVRDGTDTKGLVAPEAYLGRLLGGLDKPGDRAENSGKRVMAEKFLAMEAHCKVLGITIDYGE